MSNQSVKTPEKMAAFFDKRADSYDNHMLKHQHLKSMYQQIEELIPATEQPITILDLGCGTGLELASIFKKAPNAVVTGIDLSANMLNQLADKYSSKKGQLNLIQGSYLEVEFGRAIFDYAISVQTVHHLLHDAKLSLYRKIREALKPGRIYIEADYIVSPQQEQDMLRDYHRKLHLIQSTGQGDHHIDIPFSVTTQTSLLLGAAFERVEFNWEQDCAVVLTAHSYAQGVR